MGRQGFALPLYMYNGAVEFLASFWVMQKVVTEDGTARGLLLSPILEQVRCVLFNSDLIKFCDSRLEVCLEFFLWCKK